MDIHSLNKLYQKGIKKLQLYSVFFQCPKFLNTLSSEITSSTFANISSVLQKEELLILNIQFVF